MQGGREVEQYPTASNVKQMLISLYGEAIIFDRDHFLFQ